METWAVGVGATGSWAMELSQSHHGGSIQTLYVLPYGKALQIDTTWAFLDPVETEQNAATCLSARSARISQVLERRIAKAGDWI